MPTLRCPAMRGSTQVERNDTNGGPLAFRILKGETSKMESKHAGPQRTRAGWLNELLARWIGNSERGAKFGQWAARTIALPQLKKLVGRDIAWAPLRKPLSDSKVVLVTTGGVHLQSDPPFHLNGDFTPGLQSNRRTSRHQSGISNRAVA